MFNIRPFTAMKISQAAKKPKKVRQTLKRFPLNFLPKSFENSPKWQNFAKSGHTRGKYDLSERMSKEV